MFCCLFSFSIICQEFHALLDEDGHWQGMSPCGLTAYPVTCIVYDRPIHGYLQRASSLHQELVLGGFSGMEFYGTLCWLYVTCTLGCAHLFQYNPNCRIWSMHSWCPYMLSTFSTTLLSGSTLLLLWASSVFSKIGWEPIFKEMNLPSSVLSDYTVFKLTTVILLDGIESFQMCSNNVINIVAFLLGFTTDHMMNNFESVLLELS